MHKAQIGRFVIISVIHSFSAIISSILCSSAHQTSEGKLKVFFVRVFGEFCG